MNTEFKLNGLVAATHTPMNADGSCNHDVVATQAAFLASQGIKTVFITGSTGESAHMQLTERKENIAAWGEASKATGINVVVHTGGNCVLDGKELAAYAAANGAVATSSNAPCYFKPGSAELLVDCCAVAASGAPELPYYYYDIPPLTGVSFNPVQVMKLAEAKIPNFRGLKFTNPDLALYMDALNYKDGEYDCPWGCDEWLLGALATGAKGGVGSSFNYAPKLYQDIIAAFNAGDMAEAQRLQLLSVKMINIIAAKGYMGCCKTIMGWWGVDCGPARLPMGKQDAATIAALKSELTAIGFFDWAINK
ncbi:MAG: dihydrodipicolinate synthase family protein [Akkermansia sp.]